MLYELRRLQIKVRPNPIKSNCFSPIDSFFVFIEIEDFLTEKECNDIILMAQTVGLEQSKTLGEENFNVETNGNETNKESLPEGSEEIFKSLDSNDDGRLDTTEVGFIP